MAGGLSYLSHAVFRPVWAGGNKLWGQFSALQIYFNSKGNLLEENEALKRKLDIQNALLAGYDVFLDENNNLKNILGRKQDGMNLVLAGILSKPNQSPYDILVIDAGEKEGLGKGNLVFAEGNIPIGRITEVFPGTSKVTLFSTSKEKTEVVISGRDVFMQVTGRGGGNFEMILPRDFKIEIGTEVVLPGISSYVVARVETIISDPRDAFAKALLVSPVNIFELKFVQVRTQK